MSKAKDAPDIAQQLDSVPIADLDTLKAAKLQEINTWVDQQLAVILNLYPETEVQSWDEQLREANLFIADPSAATPLLSALAQTRGVTVTYLAAKVVEKSNAFSVFSGQVFGQRQAWEDQLSVVTRPSQITSLVIPTE